MACISRSPMFRSNCLSSSRMPVGLVTLISVTKPPITSRPTKIMPFSASTGPICPASQRSRSLSRSEPTNACGARHVDLGDEAADHIEADEDHAFLGEHRPDLPGKPAVALVE